jgi:hypothetical protein
LAWFARISVWLRKRPSQPSICTIDVVQAQPGPQSSISLASLAATQSAALRGSLGQIDSTKGRISGPGVSDSAHRWPPHVHIKAKPQPTWFALEYARHVLASAISNSRRSALILLYIMGSRASTSTRGSSSSSGPGEHVLRRSYSDPTKLRQFLDQIWGRDQYKIRVSTS